MAKDDEKKLTKKQREEAEAEKQEQAAEEPTQDELKERGEWEPAPPYEGPEDDDPSLTKEDIERRNRNAPPAPAGR